MIKEIRFEKVSYQRNIDLNIDPECHECTSHSTSGGYPCISRKGFKYMHRYIYYQKTGQKPEVVMHKCDNRICINPNHLKAGTRLENALDRSSKGRTVTSDRSGENNTQSKLTEEDVKSIRDMIYKGYSNVSIGKSFGVTHQQISHIRCGRKWKEVEG